jgi:hypothetical protein
MASSSVHIIYSTMVAAFQRLSVNFLEAKLATTSDRVHDYGENMGNSSSTLSSTTPLKFLRDLAKRLNFQGRGLEFSTPRQLLELICMCV